MKINVETEVEIVIRLSEAEAQELCDELGASSDPRNYELYDSLSNKLDELKDKNED